MSESPESVDQKLASACANLQQAEVLDQAELTRRKHAQEARDTANLILQTCTDLSQPQADILAEIFSRLSQLQLPLPSIRSEPIKKPLRTRRLG